MKPLLFFPFCPCMETTPHPSSSSQPALASQQSLPLREFSVPMVKLLGMTLGDPPAAPMRKQVAPRKGDPVDRLTMPEARHMITSMSRWQELKMIEFENLDEVNKQLTAENIQVNGELAERYKDLAALRQSAQELAAMVVDLEKRTEAACAHNTELKQALTESMRREKNLRLEIARLNARIIIVTSLEDLCK